MVKEFTWRETTLAERETTSSRQATCAMVFYFTCSDPRYTIYMGRDKYEYMATAHSVQVSAAMMTTMGTK